ncbi:unnamed protein product [Auanema sp. JU1783]|nr:unnamed protein product [Auanema sp. JU1783]
MKKFDIDDLICKLLNVGTPGNSLVATVSEETILQLCHIARNVIASQPTLIEIESPVKICGDIHGQYSDLLRLFNRGGFPPVVNYLFLGDYVDRGHQNLEVITLLLSYKVKYPNNFFLLRGNHECPAINRVYGFFEECNRRYGSPHIWLAFQSVFGTLPLSGLVSKRILCMHGGISPDLTSIEQLRNLNRLPEPVNPSVQLDLLWSDPDGAINGWAPSSRGVSFVFGVDALQSILKSLEIDLIARAHQVVQDGYEFFGNKKLVTIFSAPHYCGQFDNAAAMMNVDENLLCSFHVLRPSLRKTVIPKFKY